jgi:hypothetical protein
VVNFIPLRTGTNYSDGAKIYQLISGGPWADFHRTVALVTSSLVTPIQPRDYDLTVIQRAAHTIDRGTMAALLRIWTYSHFLDSGRIPEAAQALQEAESVVRASVPDLPAELHTVFVFANAYVRRDAAATRQWWNLMQAKKPTRFNVDYYRAESALHWMEGNLAQANDAWIKSDALAHQLPKAGAYEFDRTCCTLLRQAIDATPGGQLALAPRPAPAAVLNGVPLAPEPAYQWSFMKDVPSPHQASPAVSE